MSKDSTHTSSEILLPSPEEMFLKVPLYQPFGIEVPDQHIPEIINQILDIEFFNDALRTYCKSCKKESVFRTDRIADGELLRPFLTPHGAIVAISGQSKFRTQRNQFRSIMSPELQKYVFSNRFFTVEFYCTHKHEHRIAFCFAVHDMQLTKIGQYPSISDFSLPGIKKYRKVLTKEKMSEFTRAINLFSHDIGIGSFVYLRRIFENFIFEAYQEAVKENKWTEDDFITMRMEDKILSLKEYLPDFLVENRTIYSILSKGIHELSEEECLKYFHAVRGAIELVLEEKIAETIKEEKTQDIRKRLNAISSEMKST